MVQPAQLRISADEYFASDAHKQHHLIELIDGFVILGKPSSLRHQSIVGNILVALVDKSRRDSGEALMRPTEVYFDEYNIFEPDVLYLVPDSQCEVGEKRLVGAPELIVEVLSPSTARFDRQQKYQAYEKHGVREYWIVDPVHETIEVYVLNEDKFQRQGAYGTEDIFQSPLLAQDVAVKPLFPDESE